MVNPRPVKVLAYPDESDPGWWHLFEVTDTGEACLGTLRLTQAELERLFPGVQFLDTVKFLERVHMYTGCDHALTLPMRVNETIVGYRCACGDKGMTVEEYNRCVEKLA